MIEVKTVETGPGLVFDALVDGPEDAPLVLLLHGFAESFHTWRSQMPKLAAAGYRPVAPSQRGYSTGARPDTREPGNYSFDHLMNDKEGGYGYDASTLAIGPWQMTVNEHRPTIPAAPCKIGDIMVAIEAHLPA